MLFGESIDLGHDLRLRHWTPQVLKLLSQSFDGSDVRHHAVPFQELKVEESGLKYVSACRSTLQILSSEFDPNGVSSFTVYKVLLLFERDSRHWDHSSICVLPFPPFDLLGVGDRARCYFRFRLPRFPLFRFH